MRGAPQVGFSATMRKIRSRSPLLTHFLPDLVLCLEIHVLRDASVWPLYGQTKLQGALAGPLFPVNGIHMWVGAVGTDNVQSGTLASPIGTGTVTAAAAGATTLAYTVTGATAAPAAGGGEYYQIGPAIATLAVPALATAGTQVVKSTSY